MMSTTGFYEYEALPTAEPYIRLITLLPRDEDGVINLRLETVKFFPMVIKTHLLWTAYRGRDDRQIPYEAISYTWGSDHKMHTVKVNGKAFELRENIWSFLEHCYTLDERTSHQNDEGPDDSLVPSVSYFRRPRKLWIDTISINQNDLTEKSLQVSIMGKIFEAASKTVIWLGKSVSASGILGQRYISYQLKPSQKNKWGPIQSCNMNNFLEEEATLVDMSPGCILYDIITQIVSADYWTRLWIVQEVSLKLSYVVFGAYLIDLQQIAYLFTALPSLLSPKPNDNSAVAEETRAYVRKLISSNSIAMRVVERLAWGEHSLKNFGDTVGTYKHQLCSNPKDKIFGLLGITRFADEFLVNYQHSLEEIVLQAIGCLLKESKLVESRLGKDIQNVLEATNLSFRALFKFVSNQSGSHLRQFIGQTHIAYLEPTKLLLPNDVETSFLVLPGTKMEALMRCTTSSVQVKQVTEHNSTPPLCVSYTMYNMPWDVVDEVFLDLEDFTVLRNCMVVLSLTEQVDLLVKWCEDGIARPVGLISARNDGENMLNDPGHRTKRLTTVLTKTMGMCRYEFRPIRRPTAVDGYYTPWCFTLTCSLVDIVELTAISVQAEEGCPESTVSSDRR